MMNYIAASSFWTCTSRLAAFTFLSISAAVQAFSLPERGDIRSELVFVPGYFFDDNRELNTASENSHEVALLVRPFLRIQFDKNWFGFAYAEGFIADDSVDLDETDGGANSDGYVGLRELWFDYSGFTHYPEESLRFGRERVRYSDGLWMDSDIVTARWIFDTTLFEAGLGFAEKISEFRTDDNTLAPQDDNLFRTYAHARWQFSLNHFTELRAMHVSGSSESLQEPDLVYIYLGFDNDYFQYTTQETFGYYVAVQTVNGELGRASPSIAGSLSIDGWSSEVGVRWRPLREKNVAFGLHYIRSPGKAGQGFTQTGVQSNRSTFTGVASFSHRLNEALRGEVFNLNATTFYLSYARQRTWDVSFMLHKFVLDDPALGYRADGVGAIVVNQDDDLGAGIDLMYSYYWRGQKSSTPRVFSGSRVRLRLSQFSAGDAYAGVDFDGDRTRLILDAIYRW